MPDMKAVPNVIFGPPLSAVACVKVQGLGFRVWGFPGLGLGSRSFDPNESLPREVQYRGFPQLGVPFWGSP